MNYCMMTYTVARQSPNGADMKEICRLARELGFEAMDQITLYGYSAQDVRRMADDQGLKIVCYTFNPGINHTDSQQRAAGVDTFRKELENAHALGVKLLMLPLWGNPEWTREQSRQNIMAVLPEMVRLADEAGLTLTLEHFPGALAPFVVSADMTDAIAKIPDLRVTFDNGNVLTGGEDPCDGFLRNRPWIVHAHFKDFVRVPAAAGGIPGLDGHCYKAALIGEGLVDYPRLLGVMKRAGYDGYINIEYEGNDYPAGEAIRKALEYLRGVEAAIDRQMLNPV